jgi:hypothetical protein
MELSKHLRDVSRTITGKEQMLISAIARALEVIPNGKMESKVKQSKSDTGNLGKTNSKKSRKSEKGNALKQELRAKIAKLEGENVLLHERNVDLTVSIVTSKIKQRF